MISEFVIQDVSRLGDGEEAEIFQKSGIDSRNLDFDDPVSAYRTLFHLTPNASQRRLLASRITDLALWHATLEHWISHDWNPRNLAGMLDLYSRGGPEGCRYCPAPGSPRKVSETPLKHTLAAIDALQSKQDPPHP